MDKTKMENKISGHSDIPFCLHEDVSLHGIPTGEEHGFPASKFHPERISADSLAWVKELFRGGIIPSEIPPRQSQSIKLYLCSGNDMGVERDVIHQELAPLLRAYCHDSYGIDFQIVDLRYGLKEEQLVDPWLRDVFLWELNRCKAQDAKPRLAVVLGMKNGPQVLPTQIEEAIFLGLRKELRKAGCDVTLLDAWYLRDTNISPPVYILQNEIQIGNKYSMWQDVSTDLIEVIENGANLAVVSGRLPPELADSLTSSVICAELNLGLVEERADEESLAYIRLLSDRKKDIISSPGLKYLDLLPTGDKIDHRAFQRMTNLCSNMIPEVFSETKNLTTCSVSWKTLSGLNKDEDLKNYASEFSKTFYKTCRRLIDQSCQLDSENIPETLVTEIAEQWRVAGEVSDGTQIREDLAQIVQDYLLANNNNQPLIITGKEGMGKSVAAAQIARFTQTSKADLFPDVQSIVAIRFCDTSVECPSLDTVHRSLCQQLYWVMGKTQDEIPTDSDQLQLLFINLLTKAEFPGMIIIIIDSLDGIYVREQWMKTKWIPNRIASNVKLLLTVRQEEKQLLKSLAGKISPENFIALAPFDKAANEDILKAWIYKESRTVTTNQWKLFRWILQDTDNPSFLKFILRSALSLNSHTVLSKDMVPISLPQAVDYLFANLERKHGALLCKKTFGYLSCVDSGLTEQELLDMIFQDPDVSDISQSGKPNIALCKLYCLLHDIEPLIKYSNVDGTSVFNLCNSFVRKSAKERYRKTIADNHKLNNVLSEYFLYQWFGDTPRFSKAVPVIPNETNSDAIRNTPIRINKILPKCLCEAQRYHTLKSQMLCNFEWIRYMALRVSFDEFCRLYDCCKDRESLLVLDAIKLSRKALALNINYLGVELSGRLLPHARKYQCIRLLIRQCDINVHKCNPIVPVHQVFTVPGAPLSTEICLPGDSRKSRFFESEDGMLMAYQPSNNMDYQLWNLSSGQQVIDVNVPFGELFPTSCGGKICVVQDKKILSMYTTHLQCKLWSVTLTKEIVHIVVSKLYVAYIPAKGTGPVIRDTETGEVVHRFWHYSGVLAISPHDEYILCSSQTQLYLYSLPLMERKLEFQTMEITTKVKFFATLPMFLTYSVNGLLNLFRFDPVFKSSTCTKLLRDFNFLDFALNKNESLILVRSAHCLHVCGSQSGRVVQEFRQFPEDVFVDGKSTFTGAAFSSDSCMIIASRYTYICLLETRTGKPIRILLSSASPIETLIASKQSEVAVSLQENGRLQIWNLLNLDEDVSFANIATEAPISQLVAADNSERILCCGMSEDNVKLIDANTGEVTASLTHGKEKVISRLLVSHNGLYAVTTSQQDDRMFNFSDNEDMFEQDCESTNRLQEAVLWDIRTKRKLYHAVNVERVTFSSNASDIVFGISTPQDNQPLNGHLLLHLDITTEQETYVDLTTIGGFRGEPILFNLRPGSDKQTSSVISLLTASKSKNPTDTRVAVTNFFTDDDSKTAILKIHNFLTNPDVNDHIISAKFLSGTQVLFLYGKNRSSCAKKVKSALSAFIFDFSTNTLIKDLKTVFFSTDGFIEGQVSSFSSYFMSSDLRIVCLETGAVSSQLVKHKLGPSVFVLDGRYVCGLSQENRELVVIRSSDGTIKGRVVLHTRGTMICGHVNDRTISIGCVNGAVLVFSVSLELSDPLVELIQQFPSRQPKATSTGLLEVDLQRISSAKPELRRLSSRMDETRLCHLQRPPSFKLLSTSVKVVTNYNRLHNSQACCIQ